jgi:apolipoprotein N-acyltransferase
MEKLKRIGKFLVDHKPIFMVILGCFFLLSPPYYSNFKFLYALSAWLWPFFFLYYAHCSKKSYSQAIVFIFLTLGLSIRFSGVLGSNLDGAGGLLIVFAACVFWVPFAWDSAFCNQISSFVYTLVFPALYCTMNLILSACDVLPICNLAYAQYDNKPLLQLVSVVGEFGLTFLITWAASVAVFVIDHWKKPKGKRVGLIALLVLLLLHVGGAIRYMCWEENGTVVNIAQSIGPKLDQDKDDLQDFPFEKNVAALETNVIGAFEKKAGILVFSEEAFTIEDVEESRLLDHAKMLARKYSLPILLTLEVADLDNNHEGRWINKAVLIDQDGGIAAEYLKHNAIPVAESNTLVLGEAPIPMVRLAVGDSSYNVSFVICYDGNFSDFIVGMDPETQIYFNPSWDWESINDFHYRTIGVRSVEMGVNLVMTTNDGISLVSNPVGREVFRDRIDKAGLNHVTLTEVPTKSVQTFYSKYGFFINLMYPVLSMFFIAFGERRGWRRKMRIKLLERMRAAAEK